MDRLHFVGGLFVTILTGTCVLASTTNTYNTTSLPENTSSQSTTTATTLSSIFPTNISDNQIFDSKEALEYIEKYNSIATFVGKDDHYVYPGPTKPEFKVNTAWLTINSSISSDIEIWAQSADCYKCNPMFITKIYNHTVHTLLANSTHQTDLRLLISNPNGDHEKICSFEKIFTEGGDYWIFVYSEKGQCHILLANDPDIAELPILYVFLGLVGLAVAYVAGMKLYRYIRSVIARKRDSMDVTSNNDQDGGVVIVMGMNSVKGDKEENTTEENKPQPVTEKKRPRLYSLDTFRGITLVLMAFVNYGGGGYWFFEHASWNGITVADLVFPWFVFIMGVSMNFSFKSMFNKNWSIPRIAWKIVWRSAKLFLFGFMLGTHFDVADLANVRVFGVLQRLALTYLISALIHLGCARRHDSHQDRKWAVVRDIVLNIPELLINLAVLALHLSLVYALPVPGCPTGYVGPGGISEGGKYMNCTGGATGYVDYLILGYEHMYKHPTCEEVYQTPRPFDPEGVLSTLNCVFLCFLGIQYGRIILIYQNHKQRLIRFLIWAIMLAALGALLTKCSKDDGWIPANKNIWSLSYSLITASFGYALLTGLYVVSDLLGIWNGQPFIYPGMNGILIYLCHDIFSNTFPVNFVVGEQHWKLLLRCSWGATCWLIVAYKLYVKKIFVAL